MGSKQEAVSVQDGLTATLNALRPQTKAAKLRPLIPMIERKLTEGVTLETIAQTLVRGGLDISLGTLKSYLSRHRKKYGKSDDAQNVSCERPSSAAATSVEELNALMRPDPDAEAHMIARFERAGRRKK